MNFNAEELQFHIATKKKKTLPLNYQLIVYNDSHSTNQFSPDELQKLTSFSKTIETPNVVGQFNNEQHYLKSLRLILSSTYETHNRILFFLNEILPIVFMKNSLLDIGPGDGSLTKILANYFNHITVVEKSSHILNQLAQLFPSCTHVEKINKNILDVEFKTNSYDLAVLSHVLYYIDSSFWLDIISSVFNSLKENGILVIVLGGDELGKAQLIKNFGGSILKIDQLARSCHNRFGIVRTKLYASNESFIACSQEAMFHIAAFMLADANITTTKEALNKYIKENFQYSDNYFEMTTRQKYIIIRKE